MSLVLRLAAVVLLATAGQAGDTPDELAQVRAEIRTIEQRLTEIVSRQTDLARERRRLADELRLARLRVRESEVEVAQVTTTEAAAARDVTRSQEALEGAAARLRAQVTMLAVLGRAGLSPLVYHALIGGSDLQQRVTTLRALVQDQERRREELAQLAERRAAALATLSLRRQQLEDALAGLQQRRSELAATRVRVNAELAALERRRRAEAAALSDARESEARLERLWGAVAEGREHRSTDINLLRGGLPWPVPEFTIVRRFGKSVDPRYGTVTVTHGLHLGVPAGTRVRAVAEGTIAYAQFFKGYGNLVIVDHGSRVYSLYARLSAMLVRAGQRVATGDYVGIVGPEQSSEGNLYFEVRVGEEPRDPRTWLRPVRR